jgi:hypothetical protein
VITLCRGTSTLRPLSYIWCLSRQLYQMVCIFCTVGRGGGGGLLSCHSPSYFAVLGGPLPSLGAVQLYRTNIPRGFTPTGNGGEDPPPTGTGLITITAFPAPGTLDAIAGTLSGIATPASYKTIMYMQDQGGNWWIKPYTGQVLPIGTSGAFRADGWASYPPGDINFAAIQLYVVPLTTPVVDGGFRPYPCAALLPFSNENILQSLADLYPNPLLP